jgi:hypothetical protein
MMFSDTEMNSDTSESKTVSDNDSDDELETDKYRKYYDRIVSVFAIVAVSELTSKQQQFFVRQQQQWEKFASSLVKENAF